MFVEKRGIGMRQLAERVFGSAGTKANFSQTGESDSALGAVVMLAFLIWDPFKWFVPKA